MIKLGYKMESPGIAMDKTSSAQESKTYYPTLNIGSEYGDGSIALPCSAEDIGKTLEATVQLKLVKVGSKSENGKERHYYSFDVISIDLPEDEEDAVAYIKKRTRKVH